MSENINPKIKEFADKICELVIERSNGLIFRGNDSNGMLLAKLATTWVFQDYSGCDPSKWEEIATQIHSSFADEIIAEMLYDKAIGVDLNDGKHHPLKSPVGLIELLSSGVLIDPYTFEPMLGFIAKFSK